MDVTTVTREERLAQLQAQLHELSDEQLAFLQLVIEQEQAEDFVLTPYSEERLRQSEADVKAGRLVSWEEAQERLKRKYPLLKTD